MTHLLVDTSVLIKWFHSEGEGELSESRTLRSAHVSGDVDAHMLDLATHEVGNVLVRTLHWEPDLVVDQLDDLHTILGPPLVMTAAWLRHAAALAHKHGRTWFRRTAVPTRKAKPQLSGVAGSGLGRHLDQVDIGMLDGQLQTPRQS